MAQVLGLMTTEQLDSKKSLNARRTVFHQYPNGAAPLMGLLSLMETETTDKPEFGWYEKRAQTYQTKTAQANSAGPFTNTSDVDLTAAGWSASENDTIRVYVTSVETFQVRDVIMLRNIPGTSSTEKTFQAIVTAIDTANKHMDIRISGGNVANVLNTTAANDMDVIMVGSAAAEGDRSKTGYTVWPVDVYNYTQIFRHAFHFTRTALKSGLKFDSSGVYKESAKDNSLKHMIALEKAALFGERSSDTSAVNDDSEDSIRRTMGGVLWFLKQWEKGNISNGGKFDYRPGGSDISASAWDADDNKRIIDVNGTLTKDEFADLIERAFRFTNATTYEKLVLCGGGFLSAFNKFVDRESLRTTKLLAEEVYGMDITTWHSPFGTLHFKTHPLFNQTPVYRNSAFLLDVGELRYTAMQDSDTNLLKNRQAPDYDGRKDEWLTECGIEVRFPENHMFIDRLTGITS